MEPDHTIFITLVNSEADAANASIMINSLRTYGGVLKDAPVWIFTSEGDEPYSLPAVAKILLLRIDVEEELGNYAFGEVVCACAQAEALVPAGVQSIVWVDPTCIFLQPPILLSLDEDEWAAIRPVHIQNVGLTVGECLDDYWQGIYSSAGVEALPGSVRSYVDQKDLKPYFNTHCFAISPSLGLLQLWQKVFTSLILNDDFQRTACKDELHRVFLFQAILSTLLVSRVGWKHLRILPPEYNYPMHFHQIMSENQRVKSLGGLVSLTNEGKGIDPLIFRDI